MTPELRTVLAVASNHGSVAQASEATGGLALEAAGDNGWVQVVHARHGVVGARWAVLAATSDEQHRELTVHLTPAGRDRLERA